MRERRDTRAAWIMAAIAALGAWVLAIALAGCAGMTSAQKADTAIAVGGDVLACAGDEFGAVDDAIKHGGGSWIAVVMAGWGCIRNVVQDIRKNEAIAEWCDQHRSYDRELVQQWRSYECGSRLAEAGPGVTVDPKLTRLSRGAKQRLAVAQVLGAIMERNTKP